MGPHEIRKSAVMTRRWPRVVMPLLGVVALTLTMLPGGAGATTTGAPMRIMAGLLHDRSCQGLLSAADFPGTHYTGEFNFHGQKVCAFAGGTSKAPTGAEVTLKVLASATAAHAFFKTISTASPGAGINEQFYKLKGYGNEAVYGRVCSDDGTVCGPDVEVRVDNDVFTIAVVRVSAPLTKLAGKVVSELCPNCKFTTSPHASSG